MGSAIDSFDESCLDAFIESPLHERDGIGVAMVAGGLDGVSGRNTNIAELYDSQLGVWGRVSNMVYPQDGSAGCTVKDTHLVVGGASAHLPGDPPIPASPNVRVPQAYNYRQDTWEFKASQVYGSEWVTYDNRMSAIGSKAYYTGFGSLFGDPPTYNYHAYAYDPVADDWTSLAELQYPHRWYHASVGWEGDLYVCGGYNQDAYPNRLFDCDKYSVALDSWSSMSNMLTRRQGHTASKAPTGLLMSGGVRQSGNISKMADLLDIPADTWTGATDLPSKRMDHGASTVDNKPHTFGGFSGQYLRSVVWYNLATAAWVAGTIMNTPKRIDVTAGSQGE